MNRITPPAAAGDTPSDDLSELRRQVERESAHGRALVADIHDNPVGTVVLDPNIPCIRLVWRGYATDLQFRYVHEVMLVLIRNHRIAKILADNSQLQALGEDIRRWIVSDWIPRAVAAGLHVVAATAPRSVFASGPLRELVMSLTGPFVLQFFPDLDAARDSLRAYRPEA